MKISHYKIFEFLGLVLMFNFIGSAELMADFSYTFCIQNKDHINYHWAHAQVEYPYESDYLSGGCNTKRVNGPSCKPDEKGCCKTVHDIDNDCNNDVKVRFYVDAQTYTFQVSEHTVPTLYDGLEEFFTIYSGHQDCPTGGVQGYCVKQN